MPKKKTSEQEFQGDVVSWLNEEIKRRSSIGLDKATQEPSKITPKRSDVVVWWNRAAVSAFFSIELKTPETPITDLELLNDATAKAQSWNAPYFVIWNMQMAQLYQTPVSGFANPTNLIFAFPLNPQIKSVEDWLDPKLAALLKKDALSIFDKVWGQVALKGTRVEIEASVFVDRLAFRLNQLREFFEPALSERAKKNPTVRKQLKQLAATQGFAGFVDNIDAAVSGQYAYRLIGQILFYFALSRKQTLKPLVISDKDKLPDALRPFWNEVRKFDYEALFEASELDALVPFPVEAAVVTRQLIEELRRYDWSHLRDDVLGSVFEKLIPRTEQMLLGQFYTPTRVADLLIAFAVDPSNPVVLDPGCGSGTFLMRAYDYIRTQGNLSHADALSNIWGFDISAFATELAAINLFRQDMAAFDNFPRVIPGNFFDRSVGEAWEFPPPRSGGQKKIPVAIPQFGSVVANPPYLKSQKQDDLDPSYKATLFDAAAKNGVAAPQKTDLFAFFIYKALEFMPPGSRLGFVVSSSWLTADFGATLQDVLLRRFKLIAVIGSSVEAFFTQVDVNAVLIVAEKRADPKVEAGEKIRFVNLKRRLEDIFAGEPSEYWGRVTGLADAIELSSGSKETEDFRVNVVSAEGESEALAAQNSVRNWSLYVRAPRSYFALFGGLA
jgi:type I restriction-modification system DNA methylase subunit